MNPENELKSSTPTLATEGSGSPSSFLITVTKEGHLVVRLPLSVLKTALTVMGFADFLAYMT